MRSGHLNPCRINLPRRILRPPSLLYSGSPTPRQFSRKSPRLLLAAHRNIPRPQLPFLYPSTQGSPSGQQIHRLFSISANGKRFIKDTAKNTVKFTILIWIGVTSVSTLSLGILSERQERAFPSPHEWSFYTRFRFRRGRWFEIPENNEDIGFPNWARLHDEYAIALRRLEDPNVDGEGIVVQEEGALLVPVLGTSGFDLTSKSEEWRQGYYEVLMGMARASERLEGWVADKGRNQVWGPEFIASPSNPRPKATPPGMTPPPNEEDQCVVADPPENFYFRILTSTGFTTHQRVTAALGYADWLSFKKLNESAEEMYKWALDIAIAGLPTPEHLSVIDTNTAVISGSAPKDTITPNLVIAATSLATFYASLGNVTSALPIFISILRARLSAEPGPAAPRAPTYDSSLIGTITSLFNEPAYPPLPPTGNEPLRRREEDRCDEAALKNYIGEILFATAGASPTQRRQGLHWVRDGVSTSKIAQSFEDIEKDAALRKKCEQCEEVGLESWGKMMTFLAAEAREKRDSVKAGGLKNLGWKISGMEQLDKEVEDLEDEEEGVTMRLNKLRGKMQREEYDEMDRKYARTFAF
ncbi:hypothetical protein B0J11DRAFT_290892 [Dendryphion nanum]|uniref:Uncharacterized protein n=1 Tax=Dendryphion nanum TaxID=256645 RepID=A0A9P9DXE7_9PLEO|nr:hypothetical protein B0J11DRAFT_290892 [Dendryphion nanum]